MEEFLGFIFGANSGPLFIGLAFKGGQSDYRIPIIRCGFFLPLGKKVLQSRDIGDVVALIFRSLFLPVAGELFLKLGQLLFIALYVLYVVREVA